VGRRFDIFGAMTASSGLRLCLLLMLLANCSCIVLVSFERCWSSHDHSGQTRALFCPEHPLQILDKNFTAYVLGPASATAAYPSYPNTGSYAPDDVVGSTLIASAGYQLSVVLTFLSTVQGSAMCAVIRSVSARPRGSYSFVIRAEAIPAIVSLLGLAGRHPGNICRHSG
jgi:hypothetical protein